MKMIVCSGAVVWFRALDAPGMDADAMWRCTGDVWLMI